MFHSSFLAGLAVASCIGNVLAQTFLTPTLGYFVLNAIAPTNDSFLTFESVNANQGNFWLAKPSGTVCGNPCCGTNIHAVMSTAFWTSSNSLDASGASGAAAIHLSTLSSYEGKGQLVYIAAADGALSYTTPGEAVPGDAAVSEFVYFPEKTRLDYGQLVADGRDWTACVADVTRDQWKIHSHAQGATLPEGCFKIVMATRPKWDGVNVGSFN